jgi:hypothetical protein
MHPIAVLKDRALSYAQLGFGGPGRGGGGGGLGTGGPPEHANSHAALETCRFADGFALGPLHVTGTGTHIRTGG